MCRAIKEEEQAALIFNLTNKIWFIITELQIWGILCHHHWSNTLLHWVLFASIFFVPFKSNYHSDQFLQKMFGKFSCLHLAYPTRSLFITLTYCILTNFHSDQLSLWHKILGKLSCLHIFFLSLSSLIITLTNCHTRFLETILFASLLCVPFKSY